MLEIFVPDMLIVIMSWVSFWLHPLAVPGRISLGAITVLTMSSQGSTARLNAPQVSYPKAIDVWTLFQAMFVFAALIEFSIVNVLARRKVSEETAAEMAAKRKEIHVYDNVLASKQMSEEEADKIAKKKYREVCKNKFKYQCRMQSSGNRFILNRLFPSIFFPSKFLQTFKPAASLCIFLVRNRLSFFFFI